GHRAADVEQHVTVEVRFFFVFLDVVAVGSRVHLPVHRGEIVARHVLAILGELHAESLERTSMQAGQEALDDRARSQLESTQAGHDGGIEELPPAGWWRHPYMPLLGTGTVSSRRSMIASELIRSDSA